MSKVARIFPKGTAGAKKGGHGSYKAKRHPGSKINKRKRQMAS